APGWWRRGAWGRGGLVAVAARLGAAVRMPLAGMAVRVRRAAICPSAMIGRDRLADQLLDVAQERQLFAIAQRDRYAVGAGARRAPDPVHVGFRDVGQA